jgi:hypothetical protein
MLNLLKNLYNKAENIRGRKLAILITVVFTLFLALGLIVGYFTDLYLKNNESIYVDTMSEKEDEEPVLTTLEGKVIYVNPGFYPDENISFTLTDKDDKELVLLRAKDQILKVAENLNVSVTGVLSTTKDGTKDVLDVEKVTIKNNGSN